MFPKITEKDLKILAELRVDSRMPLTMMSRKTQVPISTLHDRLRYFKENLIKKYTSLLDFNALGYSTRAHLMVKTKNENKEVLKNYLLGHHNVNSVYKVNNGYDYLVDLVFKNIKDSEEFIEHLEQKHDVRKKEVYYIIDEVKREAFFSQQELVGMLMQ